MPNAEGDLHGNVPHTCPVALVLIDVINDLEFPGADELFVRAMPAAERIAALKTRAKQQRIPVVYANDNYGQWQSDFHKLVAHCIHDDVRGKPIAALLAPEDDDYFVLKPKHSGFYSTTLDTLLTYLGARTLILTGFAGNSCVMFTAHDAFMRDFRLVVPADCIASIEDEDNEFALRHMASVLKASTSPSTELDLPALLAAC